MAVSVSGPAVAIGHAVSVFARAVAVAIGHAVSVSGPAVSVSGPAVSVSGPTVSVSGPTVSRRNRIRGWVCANSWHSTCLKYKFAADW